jgi:hypothetical protein
MARCKTCEISLTMAKKKNRKNKKRIGSTGSKCSCKSLTAMDIVYGVGGAAGSLLLNAGINKFVLDKMTDGNMKSMVKRIIPVAKAGLSLYANQKLTDKNAKTANLGFGIVSGLEAVIVNLPTAAKNLAFIGSTSDIFSQIGDSETVYIPIGPGGNRDENNDFFTEDAVLGTEKYETIAVL